MGGEGAVGDDGDADGGDKKGRSGGLGVDGGVEGGGGDSACVSVRAA